MQAMSRGDDKNEESIAQLLSQELCRIPTIRNANLFHDLDSRGLSVEEQAIVDRRIALQRSLFAKFEQSEQARKVEELCAVCPALTLAHAEWVLSEHGFREEDALEAVTSDAAFQQRLALHFPGPAVAKPGTQVHSGQPSRKLSRQDDAQAKLKPKAAELKQSRLLKKPVKQGSRVFVGRFRGRSQLTSVTDRSLQPSKSRESLCQVSGQSPDQGLTPRAAQHKVSPAGQSLLPLQQSASSRTPRTGRRSKRRQRTVFRCLWPDAEIGAHLTGTASEDVLPAVLIQDRPRNAESAVPALSHSGQRGLEIAWDSSCWQRESVLPEQTPCDISAEASPAANIINSTYLPAQTAAAAEPAKLMTGDLVTDEHPQKQAGQQQQQSSCALAGNNMGTAAPGKAGKRCNMAAEQPGTAAEHAQPSHLANLSSSSQQDACTGCTHATSNARMLSTNHAPEAAGQPAEDAMPHQGARQQACSPQSTPAAPAGRSVPRRASAQRANELIRAANHFKLPAAAFSPVKGSARDGRKALMATNNTKYRLAKQHGQAGRGRPDGQSAHEDLAAASGMQHAANAGAPSDRKPKLGRMKKGSNKHVELVAVGSLRSDPGWYNAGCIFPEGFISSTVFRSSVQLDQLCRHECKILGRRGAFWPQPTFVVTAADLPKAPLEAKSATGAWNSVLARINACIEARRDAGEALPPPPKTAIAGPDYFGLTHPAILPTIEALDRAHTCAAYWAGKQTRTAYCQTHHHGPCKRPRAPATRRHRRSDSDSEDCSLGESAPEACRGGSDDDDDDDSANFSCRWSGLDRAERHRRRMGCQVPALKDDPASGAADEDSILPNLLDPITLQTMIRPAVSPFGHVLGMATWAAVLADGGRCPFTQSPLRREQVILLTQKNIERYRDRLILP